MLDKNTADLGTLTRNVLTAFGLGIFVLAPALVFNTHAETVAKEKSFAALLQNDEEAGRAQPFEKVYAYVTGQSSNAAALVPLPGYHKDLVCLRDATGAERALFVSHEEGRVPTFSRLDVDAKIADKINTYCRQILDKIRPESDTKSDDPGAHSGR